MKKVIIGRTHPQSNLSFHLLNTEWDFTQFDAKVPEDFHPADLEDYAHALKAVLDAMDHVGNVEHSNDWDPYVLIDLRDGTQVQTPAGYFGIKGLVNGLMLVEAPSTQDYTDWAEPIPPKYYDGKMEQFVIPLGAISRITIHS